MIRCPNVCPNNCWDLWLVYAKVIREANSDINVVVPEGFLKAGGRFKRPPPMKAAAEEEVKGSFVMYHFDGHGIDWTRG